MKRQRKIVKPEAVAALLERIATPSYGCVFCDMGLNPQDHENKPMHYVHAHKIWLACKKTKS